MASKVSHNPPSLLYHTLRNCGTNNGSNDGDLALLSLRLSPVLIKTRYKIERQPASRETFFIPVIEPLSTPPQKDF